MCVCLAKSVCVPIICVYVCAYCVCAYCMCVCLLYVCVSVPIVCVPIVCVPIVCVCVCYVPSQEVQALRPLRHGATYSVTEGTSNSSIELDWLEVELAQLITQSIRVTHSINTHSINTHSINTHSINTHSINTHEDQHT
jgi:hypothetical protein